jgi:hypothetical protein
MDGQHDEHRHTPLCCLAETKFAEMDRRYDAKFDALEEAIGKAEHAMNIRLESMNQFRQQILDERSSFATRRESVLVSFIIALVLLGIGTLVTHLMRP